jgi:tetratricopeptide (TPR) repeat protein/serine/threonine protein kinase
MTNWNPRANDVFLKALELRSPAERRQYLDEACAGDAALRAEVESLLEASERAGRFLESSPAGLAGTIDAPETNAMSGTVVGVYKLIEQIGEGGMGTVWMAQQTDPVKRLVALKLIKAGMDSKQVIARFEAERQALALMDHPNIARVLDGGTTSAGRPYFVMDLVKGVPITKYCDKHYLTPRQRLELFIPVCQAVQHAHQKGIIHRDLKPSNVLVSLYDGKPVPKVIDFGVAKAAGPSLTDKTLVTGFGNIVGTLEYMSPEQAELNQLDIDTRSDIYSLGVLLYELLAGSPPFSRKELEKAGMLEMLRVIREQEPSKPSTKLSTAEGLPTLAANRGTEPAKLTKLVRGELDWIVMKALEKDRNRRYQTANGFAADVQRYLSGEAVQAVPQSPGYRLRKVVRRNKVALGMASIVAVAVLLVVGSVGWVVRDRAAREQELARAHEARQAKLNQEVELALRDASTLRERALTVTDNPDHWDATLAVAASALRRAEGLAAQDEAALEPQARDRLNELRAILDADQNDRRFAARFDEIRLEQTRLDLVHSRFMEETSYDAVKHALKAAYGIEIGTTPAEEVAALVRQRPKAVQEFLNAALDLAIIHAQSPVTRKWLIAASDAADKDQWRKEARRAVAARDESAIEKLAREALAARRPVSVLRWLASGLPGTGEVRLKLYREIQQAYPGDFWANHDLAIMLQYQSPPRYEEAIRFHTAAIALRPRDPASHVNLGRALRGEGDLDAGMVAFRRAVDLAPNYPMAYQALGSALNAKGDRDGAEAVYRKSVDFAPSRVLALYQLGVTRHLDDRDLDGCIATYREVIRLNPTFAVAYHNLGIAYSEQKKLPEAVAAYKKAIEINPNYAGAHYSLGILLSDQGELDEAIAEYHKAIELDPTNAKSRYGLGYVRVRQGKDDDAIVAYRKAIVLDPKFGIAYHGLGNTLMRQGKHDEAIGPLRKAIQLDPKNANAYSSLGYALCHLTNHSNPKLRDPQRAIDLAKEAVEIAPQSAAAWQLFGWVQYRVGNWVASIEALEKSCKLQNLGDGGQWIVMALAHGKLASASDLPEPERIRHKAAARRLFDDAVKQINSLGPEGDEAIRAFRAEAAELLGNEAIKSLEKIVASQPDAWEPRANLAAAYASEGQREKAAAEYTKAIELKLDAWEPWSRRAFFHFSGKQWNEAVSDFTKAIDLAPQVHTNWWHRGHVYLQLAEWDKAAADFGMIVDRWPDGAEGWYLRGVAFAQLKQPDKALADLRQAIAKGFEHVEWLGSDPRLDPLRSNDEFKKLRTLEHGARALVR